MLVKIKNFVFDVLTFSYPKYRLVSFLVVLFLLLVIPINILESSPKLSVCKAILGEKCFSIGITRGVSCLLKGNLGHALEYNFLSVPVLIFLIGFAIYDFYNLFIKCRSFKK